MVCENGGNSLACIGDLLFQTLSRSSIRSKRVSSFSEIRVETCHLHLIYRNMQCSIGEEAEVQFSLYDLKTNRYFR